MKQKASPDRFTFKRRPRVRISKRIVPWGTPTLTDGQSENASHVLTRCTPYFKRSKRTVAHNRCRHFSCNKLWIQHQDSMVSTPLTVNSKWRTKISYNFKGKVSSGEDPNMTVKTINRSQLEHWGRSISTCVLKVGFHQAWDPRGLLPSPHMDKKQKTEKKRQRKEKKDQANIQLPWRNSLVMQWRLNYYMAKTLFSCGTERERYPHLASLVG